MQKKVYIAIDLKSFYASVECIERGLDPMTTNLVVADISRTNKTICLAVSPSLKECGIPGRPRLFEVEQKVKAVNASRQNKAPNHTFAGSSTDAPTLKTHPELAVDYIVAVPRMALYEKYSARVYSIYLQYIAPEDIHAYSIDEVFIDATNYLHLYHKTARELTMTMIQDVLRATGITATAGIGTNLYLCKVAMDIGAKHVLPDKNGVRISELDELGYRKRYWGHRPLTDFWRVGKGYAKKLESVNLYTMGDIARCSLGGSSDFYNEDLLYKMFGVNAELLIDHAWGWEPCTMQDIKSYKSATKSICSGQVLSEPYACKKARLVIQEMADALSLDLVRKNLVTSQLVLDVGYDVESLKNGEYHGIIEKDRYGRAVPKPSHGSANFPQQTSSTRQIISVALELFDHITQPSLLIRRLTITAAGVAEKTSLIESEQEVEQLSLFTSPVKEETGKETQRAREKEMMLQKTIVQIQGKYGKNALLKGFNLEEGATARDRNMQIGGHKA